MRSRRRNIAREILSTNPQQKNNIRNFITLGELLYHFGWVTLTEKHKSRPYNPNIASAFFRAGLVETWGRGIAKVQQICRTQGYPEPEFEVLGEDLLLRQLKNIAWTQRQIDA